MFSRTATKMISVLLVLFVLDVYHSATLSGFVVLAFLIPGVFVGPVAGALLDRRGRVALIATDYFVGGLAFLLLSALSLANCLPRFWLIVIAAIGGVTQPLSNVGTRSLVPAMVPRHLWDHANAVDSTGYVVANVFGPAMAGAAVAIFGARAALFLPALFLAVAAAFLIGLRVPDLTVASPNSVLTDALAGLRYVWEHSILRMVGITASVYFMSNGVLSVGLPLLLEHRLGLGSVAVGVGFAASGVTGFLSGLIAGRVGTAGRERRIFTSAGIATAAAMLFMATTHSEAGVLVAMAVIGATSGPLTVAIFSIRQRVTDPFWFGRAFAVSMTINGLGNPIGASLAGLLAAHSIALALVAGAVLAIAAAILPAGLRQEGTQTVEATRR